ncbi:uncharacterized protein LOC129773006 [Toxorhynchites rutilus septentrionalis]|uniref:uncharacterized protein LOC129773006 n=1 Tax=Toxorhynchites rutilus septentrionalis TaxID=329112 RepID=UPI002478FCEB|nr:uncharacterized protein LOC129773006 [Toxorhynchites rutilus septentrionalis]
MDAYLSDRTEFEKRYYRTKGILMQFNNVSSRQQHMQNPQRESPSQMSCIKLPDVKLPVFNGQFESWLNFHDLFDSLVHSSTNLSTIQKFYYLRSSLAGEALKVIQTIPITSDQYAVAWKMLVDHFSNPRRLKRIYVQSLFEFSTIRRENASELYSLVEKFETSVRVLKQLGEHTEYWDVLLIHLLSTRLDPVSRRDWEEYAETLENVTFDEIVQFLQRRVNVLQSVVIKPAEVQQFNVKKNCIQRSGNIGTFQNAARECTACSGQHSLYQCSALSKMSAEEKEQFIRRNQLCRNCMRRGHVLKECPSESNCRKCGGRHHTLLCSAQRSVNSKQTASIQQSPVINQPSYSKGNEYTVSSTPVVHTGITNFTRNDRTSHRVLLATAIVLLVDDNGVEHPVRALLDSGSECCFVTERVSQRMYIHRKKVNLPIAGIGQSSTQVRFMIRSMLKSRHSNYTAEIDFYVLPRVTVDLPCISVDISTWKFPTGIQLADPSFYESSNIDVVIGAEIFFDIFKPSGRLSLGNSLPWLINSTFGWIVSGNTHQKHANTSFTCNIATTADLHRDMERFWAIEEDSMKAFSPQETACESYFTETTIREPDGRYTVRLPFKKEIVHNLADNKQTALRRFRHIENRLNRNSSLAMEYRDFMEEYLWLGHMQAISESQITTQSSHFLPHHPVIREDHTTTKQIPYPTKTKKEMNEEKLSFNNTGQVELQVPPPGDIIIKDAVTPPSQPAAAEAVAGISQEKKMGERENIIKGVKGAIEWKNEKRRKNQRKVFLRSGIYLQTLLIVCK